MKRGSSPKITVVVCAFNEEVLLRSCLNGLLSQTYPRDQYEVIVIDDESTDQTYAISSEFIAALGDKTPRIRLIRIQHGGLSVARNAGIQLGEGHVIAFIDGDAVPETTWLEELAKPFAAGADYVGGRINLLNTDSWVARFLQRTRNRQFFGPRIFNDQCVGCNMAFRKGVFDAVGGFQENCSARGDESTLQERIRTRFKYAPAPDAVVLHERPDTLMKSLRVEWKSATLSSLVNKAFGRTVHWKSSCLVFEQFLMVLFPILLGLVWIAPRFLALPLAIAVVAVVRRLYLRPLNHAIARGLVHDYGLLHGTLGHILFCFTHNTLSFLGRLVSPWLHYNVTIIAPMATPLTVLKTVDSASGSVRSDGSSWTVSKS